MDHRPHHASQKYRHQRVTALFGDHEQSFDLMPGTTLVQLAERLADLARQNHGWPMGITVVFDTAAKPASNARSRQSESATRAGQAR